jgi:acyl carrier protein
MTGSTTTSIESRVRDVFKSVFSSGVEYQPDLLRKDIKGWDSLKHVEFMIALEREFSVRFDGSDATTIVGVAKALEVVRNKLA